MSIVEIKLKKTSETLPRKYELLWTNIIVFVYFHLSGIYGIYLLFCAKFYTLLWAFLVHQISLFGVTAGAHRLFAHRSFKAKLPLKILLVICQTVAQQGSIIGWSHNHRLHHKFSDTDADPHNASRGIFFSHIGWVFVHYHPLLLEKRRTISISDLSRDPILSFQKKYFMIFMPLLAFIIPSVVPFYFWKESLSVAYHINIVRYLIGLHITFAINSWAHTFGNKPYDRFIRPGDNFWCSLLTQGEGFHNYHHAFPWDYKTSEWGIHGNSFTTTIIDFMATIGWAYDLKVASEELVIRTKQNRGEETYSFEKNENKIGLAKM